MLWAPAHKVYLLRICKIMETENQLSQAVHPFSLRSLLDKLKILINRFIYLFFSLQSFIIYLQRNL